MQDFVHPPHHPYGSVWLSLAKRGEGNSTKQRASSPFHAVFEVFIYICLGAAKEQLATCLALPSKCINIPPREIT